MSKGPGFFGGSGAGERLGGSDLVKQVMESHRVFSGALTEVKQTIEHHSEQELDQGSRLTT